jgi:dTDP-4-amino-4,6-dideoxygalactose transaminase
VNPIHLFVPDYDIESTLAEIRECLEKGWTGLGFKTIQFEKAWSDYSGFPNAHFVNSGTAALHLAVHLLKRHGGWRDGDEVITTPLTFVSTNHVLLYEGLKPIFADVDKHLCLDPTSVESKITSRTRAVMFVAMGGNPGRLDEIAALCKAHRLRLIVDGAHAAGSRLNGHVGLDADAFCLSMHSVKPLPTADSGLVCFKDSNLDAEARKLSWLGISKDTYARTAQAGSYRWRYGVDAVGWKYNGNSIMAAIALVALRRLDHDNERRRELAALYDQLLPGVSKPPMVGIPSRHLYQIEVDRRDDAMVALNGHEIYPGVHYQLNTDYPMYQYAKGSCPRAEQAAARLISLPLHLRLSEADVERVAAALNVLSS